MKIINQKKLIAIDKINATYPDPPYSPSEKYPEYPFSDISSSPNEVYQSIRNLLFELNFDKDRFGLSTWNPLGDIIKPGYTVFIKPNLVNSYHFSGGNIQSVITHGSIIRTIIDYVIIALQNKGKIIVGDSPERVADFSTIINISGLGEIKRFYEKNNINIEILDLRREHIEYGYGAIKKRIFLKGDPRGYKKIDLGEISKFNNLSDERLSKLYGADYNRKETLFHHKKNKHIYEISNSILLSDVIVSIPKLKTHQKAGVTLNLKGFIGCTGNKNLIPHRSLGDPSNGGDTYSQPPATSRGYIFRSIEDFLKDHLLGRYENIYSAILFSTILNFISKILFVPENDKKYIGGGWYGNDTLWRSICDIHYLINFSDKEGVLRDKPQRLFFSIVDGVIAGERNGPIEPDERKEGLLIAGQDLLSVDIICTKIMGFNPLKIPYLKNSIIQFGLNQNEIIILSKIKNFYSIFNISRENSLKFKSPDNWKGKIEL
jgi:uncharacterized protein (DUF362 family)